MRKRCHRRPVVPLPPRGLRRPLSRDQLQDLEVVHLQTLDDMARGRGTQDTLLDWAGSVLTWGKAAELTGQHAEAMAEQHHLWVRVWQRFERTGRALLTGEEYQLAKRGVETMNALAYDIDQPTARVAANWSEEQLNRLVRCHHSATRAAIHERDHGTTH